jgi:hypothetical protein
LKIFNQLAESEKPIKLEKLVELTGADEALLGKYRKFTLSGC